MKVKELQELLEKCDPDATVVVDGSQITHDFCYRPAKASRATAVYDGRMISWGLHLQDTEILGHQEVVPILWIGL